MVVRTILDSEFVAVHHHVTGSDVTVFTFGAWWKGDTDRASGPETGFGLQFLLKRGFDVVAVNPKANRWFQDLSRDDLARISKSVKTPKRAGYGSSMGGYAALLFANTIELDNVLALSPQFDPRHDELGRWPETRGFDFNHVWQRVSTCAFIAYDPKHPADNRHVEQIGAFVDFSPIDLPYSGHGAAKFLQETGELANVATSILRDGRAPKIDRDRRKNSGTYCLNLGRRTMKTGHFGLALTLARKAARLMPDAETSALLRKAESSYRASSASTTACAISA